MTGSQRDVAAISLYRRFCAGDVTPEQMAVELPPLWRSRPDPDPLHGPVAWQAMVEHAGYFCWSSEGCRAGRRPRRRHRLFRGAVPQPSRAASTQQALELLGAQRVEPAASPGERAKQLKASGEDFEEHRYIRVPRELWSHGWIAVLNGPGLAMLLILLSLGGGRGYRGLWFAPDVADRRFHLSAETRKRGLDCLRDEGLITVNHRPITQSTLDTKRWRNTYDLHVEDVLTKRGPVLAAGGETQPRTDSSGGA